MATSNEKINQQHQQIRTTSEMDEDMLLTPADEADEIVSGPTLDESALLCSDAVGLSTSGPQKAQCAKADKSGGRKEIKAMDVAESQAKQQLDKNLLGKLSETNQLASIIESFEPASADDVKMLKEVTLATIKKYQELSDSYKQTMEEWKPRFEDVVNKLEELKLKQEDINDSQRSNDVVKSKLVINQHILPAVCLRCGDSHPTFKCTIFETAEAREKVLQMNGRCKMCGRHSKSEECPVERAMQECVQCKEKHLLALCKARFGQAALEEKKQKEAEEKTKKVMRRQLAKLAKPGANVPKAENLLKSVAARRRERRKRLAKNRKTTSGEKEESEEENEEQGESEMEEEEML
ncbi:hypothetical protein CAEBREN_16242 [Caenorhabditis brenneri]|uniref:Uncharacterized protein n=1 Tax=Caenorhabditis brenneri TaxID=135651 RepID=G0P7H3_CAEBE|nr:hypothetical protein CAEBREN_16242 [Caenorhabditis brenneri]